MDFNKCFKVVDTELVYEVNEKKRYVKAKYSGDIKLRDETTLNLLLNNLIENGWTNGSVIEHEVTIKCNPNDEFDPEFGKKLARAAIKRNVMKDMAKWCSMLYGDLKTMAEAAAIEANRYSTAMKFNDDFLVNVVEERYGKEQH